MTALVSTAPFHSYPPNGGAQTKIPPWLAEGIWTRTRLGGRVLISDVYDTSILLILKNVSKSPRIVERSGLDANVVLLITKLIKYDVEFHRSISIA